MPITRHRAFAGDPGPQPYLPPSSGTGNGFPILNWDQAAAQFTRGGASWSASHGAPVTVSYAFRATGVANPGLGVSGFQVFNATQIAVTEEALLLWSEVANITFVRVLGAGGAAYSDNATILFGNFVNGGAAFSAFTYLPDPDGMNPADFEGDIWVNITRDYDADPATFPQGARILAHEIGHALGLGHPSDYDGGANSGVTYFNDADIWQDTAMFSNMSYFSESFTGAAFGIMAFAPQMLDIAAAQLLYGANMTTRTSDTVYGFHSNSGHAVFSIAQGTQAATFCIWDAGGNDTLDLSGYFNASQIDLREESFSSAGPAGGGASAAVYNISIARGAVIENAIGGIGDDTLIGNEANNVLTANDGADSLTGNGGNDTLLGGLGADAMAGGAGDDQFVVDDAGDVVMEASSEGRDTVYASITYTLGANVEELSALGAAAINLFGNGLANLIVGNGAANGIDGGAGVDTMIGGGGSDLYLVDNIADVVIEGAGEGNSDVVYTSLAFYQLGDNVEQLSVTASTGTFAVGNSVNNLIVGNAGADALDGGGGVDTLVGGGGNDSYYVDNIADVLIESASEGAADVVYTGLAFYQLGDNVEQLSINTAAGTFAVGNGLNNLIVGNAGADALDGGAGVDTLIGGGGNDSYFVDNVADVIIEGAGEGAADVVYTSLAFYALGDNVEQLSVTTASGTYAAGNSVNNLIVGNAGADALEGRMGSDVLVGNSGADSFIYNSAAEGGDAIVDFVSGVDIIRIDASGFGGGLVAGNPVTFFGGSNPVAGAGAAFLYDTDDGRLFWDADGAGGTAAALIATLSGAPTLLQGDIIVGP